MAQTNVALLDEIAEFIDSVPGNTRTAARLALNDVAAGSGLARYRKVVQSQTDFPNGYLNDERLGVTRKATDGDLRVEIVGRGRPTSLARFATGGQVGGAAGVTVRVNPGSSRRFKNAFLVRLNRGASLTDSGFNIGLALRLKPGDKLVNKRDQSNLVYLSTNVVLLYGPSIDQVFRDVAETETPEVVEAIVSEFIRQFARLNK